MNKSKIFIVLSLAFPAIGFGADTPVSTAGQVFDKPPVATSTSKPIPLLVAPDAIVPSGSASSNAQSVNSVAPATDASLESRFAAVTNMIEANVTKTLDARTLANAVPNKSETLPGMAPEKSKPIVVKALPGVNEVVTVSSLLPNRIATPFKHAQVLDLSKATIQTIGGNVFFLPKDENPVGLFIQEKDRGGDGPVISLTLLPKKIPGQNVLVMMDGLDGMSNAVPEEKQVGEAGEYTDNIRYLMRSAMRGVAPDGFVVDKMKFNKAKMGQVEAVAVNRYSGSIIDIFQYKITNTGAAPVSLTEQSFYQKGVKAVAFFPRIHLLSGQDTFVYILAAKAVQDIKGETE